MEPHREVLWNIQYAWIMYALAALTVLFFAYIVVVHVRRWRVGRRATWPAGFWRRLRVFLGTSVRDGLLHLKFLGADRGDLRFRESYAGVMHFFIFGGAIIFLLATAMDALSHYVVDFLHGTFYLWYSLVTDAFGILVFVGLGMALWRRYVWKPPRVDNQRADLVTLGLVFIVILSGFVVEGFRIAAAELPVHPEWSPWSPLGYAFALWFRGLAMPSLLTAHDAAWWVHVGLTLGAVGYVAVWNGRLLHIFWGPVNIWFRNLGPKGALEALDFENEEFFGAAKVEDLSWKQLLDTDACTRCGRCQDACPAYASGKALNPRQLIQDLKTHLYDVYPGVFRLKPAAERKALLGEVISDEVIWDCTTCRACVQACPVAVEHVDTLMDLRRDLAMEQSRFPEAARDALKSLGTRGHPYRGTTATRTDWCDGLDVPVLSDGATPDILFWVGCSAALDERTMKTAQATVKILEAAGVSFAVLGDEETCCGDPARRLGDEYLFQTMCQANIELLNGYGIAHILTLCPHCYNSFLNEYPQFGGRYTVEHHSTYILRLIESGALKLKPGAGGAMTFHDSCYLGRYNDIYQEPRAVVRRVAGRLVEMERRLTDSFCCGGGGGHMWMEEEPEQRVNHRRVDQVLATGAGTVAVACPYCLTMLEDGLKEKGAEETCAVADLAELVAAALEETA
jgi:Fe-S oxidoreductase/nitrate reductase gamma subunit